MWITVVDKGDGRVGRGLLSGSLFFFCLALSSCFCFSAAGFWRSAVCFCLVCLLLCSSWRGGGWGGLGLLLLGCGSAPGWAAAARWACLSVLGAGVGVALALAGGGFWGGWAGSAVVWALWSAFWVGWAGVPVGSASLGICGLSGLLLWAAGACLYVVSGAGLATGAGAWPGLGLLGGLGLSLCWGAGVCGGLGWLDFLRAHLLAGAPRCCCLSAAWLWGWCFGWMCLGLWLRCWLGWLAGCLGAAGAGLLGLLWGLLLSGWCVWLGSGGS